MKPLLPVGVVGGGRHAAALADHAAPFRRFRIARWASAADGGDRTRAAALADRLSVRFSDDWPALVRDVSLSVILVLSEDPERHRIVTEALTAGKAVLCPGPIAPGPIAPPELAPVFAALLRGGGILFAPGELRYAPGARAALQSIADGEVGRLHSLYLAARTTLAGGLSGAPDVVDGLGWDVFDFVLAAVDGPIARIQARAGRLFGLAPPVDTAVILLRSSTDVIMTVELSRCLPAAFPGGSAEVEIEVVGARRAIHLEPYQTAVRVYGRAGLTLHPWVDPPVLGMMDDLLNVVEGKGARSYEVAPLQRIADVVHRVRAAVQGASRL